MSIARKCERCGGLYESYGTVPAKTNGGKPLNGINEANGFMFTKRNRANISYYCEDDARDLCPDCFESLLAWYDEKRC